MIDASDTRIEDLETETLRASPRDYTKEGDLENNVQFVILMLPLLRGLEQSFNELELCIQDAEDMPDHIQSATKLEDLEVIINIIAIPIREVQNRIENKKTRRRQPVYKDSLMQYYHPPRDFTSLLDPLKEFRDKCAKEANPYLTKAERDLQGVSNQLENIRIETHELLRCICSVLEFDPGTTATSTSSI